ncbi:MAG: hypothetical protein IPJ81_17100 [Chitinophagaceae bacterium]|nr:hypothetical protein [Chitinophagaceae bacterium]
MKLFLHIKENIIAVGDKMSLQNESFYTFQVTRSLLAFATLFTLLFSSSSSLFTHKFFNTMKLNDALLNKINLFNLVGYEYLYISKIICIIILLLVITGYFHKIISVLHWYISFSLYSSLTIVDGGDQIASIITLLLIPIALCDNRKNTWGMVQSKTGDNSLLFFVSNSFLTVIQLQIAIIYLNSGIAKVFIGDWQNGSAYYYWFTHSAFGAPGYLKYLFEGLLSNPIIVALITWGTIIFEIMLFGGLFSSNKNFKNLMFKIGITFHLLIFIIHGLFSFGLIMIGCLYIYLKSNGKEVFKLKTAP